MRIQPTSRAKTLLTKLLRHAGGRGRWLGLVWWLVVPGLTAYAQRPVIGLDLRAAGPSSDQTYVYFEQGATAGFDSGFDAMKLPNSSGLNLASIEANGQQLAINGLPATLLGAPLTVGLFVGVPAYQSYTVQVSQFDNFTAASVYLTDALLNTSLPLARGTTYTFDMTAANTAGTYASSTRFALQFVPNTVPLPVTLTSFTAGAQAGGVRVGWRTASELHSAWFGVERSSDGQQFREIGRVAAAGTSVQAHAYELLDAQPLVGPAYYRLRQTDLDGSSRYSPVVRVAGERVAARLSLYPNPTHGAATLLGAAPGAAIQVFDALGRLAATATADAAGVAILRLPIGWSAGLYVVHAGAQVTRIELL